MALLWSIRVQSCSFIGAPHYNLASRVERTGPNGMGPLSLTIFVLIIVAKLQFRERYTEVAKSRYGRDQLTARSLGEAYANGDKNCPVRLLKCIGYDTSLYERLCQAKLAMTRVPGSATAGRKRHREEEDEDENEDYDDDAPGPSKRRSLRGNLLILEALRTLARDGL